MPTDVVMPQMGESVVEGTITKWLKKPGDTVQRDEPLFEISTDKVDAEIPSPASGVLKEVKVKEGATVQVNTVVGVIDADGAGASAAAPAKAATPPSPSAPPPVAPPAAAAPAAPAAAAPAASGPGTEVMMPQMGESIVEGTITKWLKQVGDQIRRDEPLFEISTDKVDAEIPAPAAGVLSEIRVAAGQTVGVNTVVAVIGGTGAPAAVRGLYCCSPSATSCSRSSCSSRTRCGRRGRDRRRRASHTVFTARPQDRKRQQCQSRAGEGNWSRRSYHQGRHPELCSVRWSKSRCAFDCRTRSSPRGSRLPLRPHLRRSSARSSP